MIDQLEYIFSLEHINLSKERRLERLQNTVNKEKAKRECKVFTDYKIEEHEWFAYIIKTIRKWKWKN